MDASFVSEIRNDGPKYLQGRLVAPPGWHDITPADPPVPKLRVCTLTALRDYIGTYSGREIPEPENLLVHVEDEFTVELYSPINHDATPPIRENWVTAEPIEVKHPFDNFVSPETMLVWLLTRFVSTPERQAVVELVSRIQDSDVRETVDDGYAQEVITKAGVTLTGRTKIENPVFLTPYRTFLDVEQPTVPLLLRARKNGDAVGLALFEADGGAWKIEAMQRIEAWLRRELPATATIIA